ncbi:2Fe-2S ferredoxin-like protein [Thalassotalea euphylliae]|uniref:2Fe-2S ferredoxin-like protein n=1 Tax=Thalassotalea euphylliae TaxID=1655234 RepID=A0A3E0TRH7_9GAMM|nr:class I ribonucleotide reductase maintenance protein YfaE [Thalassotalea euphylliae]REL26592.1 2Fe-2S ferredoxin-like protein [Thalassotalea euphylliae]
MSSSENNKLSHKVTANGQEVIFTDKHPNLLVCLEEANIEVHYHCRDGYCGACRVKLGKGQICYPQGEPLAFVGEDEILPCCCVPTADIELTVD